MIAHTTDTVRALTEEYVQRYPADVGTVLESRPPNEVAELLEELTVEASVLAFERLPSAFAEDVIASLPPDRRSAVLGAADPMRVAACLSRLGGGDRAAVLATLAPPVAREITDLLAYPPDSAGAMMDPRVPMLGEVRTVADALEWLRDKSDGRVVAVYVVDDEGTYRGRVAIQELAIARPEVRLSELAADPALRIRATASLTEVVDLFESHRVLALPVVDFADRLIGFIRNRALLEAVEADATADVQSMVGASREERALSPVGFAVKKRLPWLEVNLLTAFLAAAVVGLFEGTIARFTALAVLLPVVAGQSGNTGAQALAVTMRGLALREVRVRQWVRVTGKEAMVALVNGVAVAVTTALAVYVWSRSLGLMLVIAISMVLSMVAAGVAGATIPMILTALRQDPAQSSSIVLTTVTDVVGFFSFLGIATLLATML